MKAFLVLIIILSLGAVAYVYREDLGIGGKKEEVADAKDAPDGPGTSADDKSGKSKGKGDKAGTPGISKRQESPEDKKLRAEVEKEFPLQKFKPIEDLVGNWSEIPQRIFNPPREVILMKDTRIEFPGGAGGVDLKKGTPVFVVSSEGTTLTIRKQPDGSMSAKVGIDDTNLKQTLNRVYKDWQKRKNDVVLNERARVFRERKIERLMAQTGSSKPPPTSLSAEERRLVGSKPDQSSNRTVPIMVQSVRNRDVSEIKIEEIDRWGSVRVDYFEGEPYWVCSVFYETPSLFGLVKAEAMALMRGGKVIDWVYPGSGEDVP